MSTPVTNYCHRCKADGIPIKPGRILCVVPHVLPAGTPCVGDASSTELEQRRVWEDDRYWGAEFQPEPAYITIANPLWYERQDWSPEW